MLNWLDQVVDLLSTAGFLSMRQGSHSSILSVLDKEKFGHGNRPYWEMKEGGVSSRHPDLLRTLSKARDPGQRRLLFESHRHKMGGMIGIPARQLEPCGIGLSRQ